LTPPAAQPSAFDPTGSLADAAAQQRSHVARQVEDERVATVYALTTSPVVAGMAFSLLVAVILWPHRPATLVLGWLALKIGTALWRLADVRRFYRTPPADRVMALWRRRSVTLLALDGTGWGLMGVIFMPEGVYGVQGVILASLVAIAAVGVFSYISLARACMAFISTVLLPSVLYQAMRGTADGWFAALGLVIYIGVLFLEAHRGELRVLEMLRLRFENAWIAEERRRALLLAEHSSAAKSRFLATVSHEMRTPLNGIMGMAQVLQRSAVTAEQGMQLEIIHNSSRHLQAVIGDLLDLSRVEFGKLAFDVRPFALAETLREVTDLLQAVAHDKGLSFEVRIAPGIAPWICGDASRIKQVLHNLIGNAIKFTPRGQVTVRAEAQGGALWFRVTDSGEGIAPDVLPRIFDAFEQGPDATLHTRSGTGLGLTISRQIARAMGGDVICDSPPGGGASFVFTLPLAPAEAPAPIAPAVAAPESAKLAGHVLVVDDNPVNAIVARAMLDRMGLQVDVADDGVQALALMGERRYDLVLMDCQLPLMDGFEATRRWRGGETSDRLPIVALTANAVLGDRERCLQAGMDDYLAKPFQMGELQQVVERHLKAA